MIRAKQERVRTSKPLKPRYALSVRNDLKMCTEKQVLWDDFKFALEKNGFPSKIIRKVERTKQVDRTIYSVAIEGVKLEEKEVVGNVKIVRRPPYDFTECVVALHNGCDMDRKLVEKVSNAIHMLDSPDFEKEKKKAKIWNTYSEGLVHCASGLTIMLVVPVVEVVISRIFEESINSLTFSTNMAMGTISGLIIGGYYMIKGISKFMESKEQEKEFNKEYR